MLEYLVKELIGVKRTTAEHTESDELPSKDNQVSKQRKKSHTKKVIELEDVD